MKILYFIFGLSLLFSSCFLSYSEKLTDSKIKKMLLGNWQSNYFEKDWTKTAFVFSFRDSTCSYLSPKGNLATYWLEHDTLCIKERTYLYKGKVYGGKKIFQFLIDSISSHTLVLTPCTSTTKKLLRHKEDQYFKSIRLQKIKHLYDWEVQRIGFYSSTCFGSCSAMYFEIDTNGSIFFNGKYATQKIGLHRGLVSHKEIESIKRNINSIALDNLQKHYSAPWTDDQNCILIIQTKTNTYKSSAYGFYEEPIPFRILLQQLQQLHQHHTLQADTTVCSQFVFEAAKYGLHHMN